jgi:lipocalin
MSGKAINDLPLLAPGKFRLRNYSNPGPIDGFDGFYWILELGEKDSSGLYTWAIVSVPYSTALYVMARDVEAFKSELAPTVLQKVAELGFTRSYNQPQVVYQASDCVYAPLPEAQDGG